MKRDKPTVLRGFVLIALFLPLISVFAGRRNDPFTAEERKFFADFRDAAQSCQSGRLIKYLEKETIFQAGGAYFFDETERAKFLNGDGVFFHFLCDSESLKKDMDSYYWDEAGFLSLKDALKIGTSLEEGRLRGKNKYFLQFRVKKNKYFIDFENISGQFTIKMLEVVYLP